MKSVIKSVHHPEGRGWPAPAGKFHPSASSGVSAASSRSTSFLGEGAQSRTALLCQLLGQDTTSAQARSLKIISISSRAQPVLTTARCRVKPRSEQMQLQVRVLLLSQRSGAMGAQQGSAVPQRQRAGQCTQRECTDGASSEGERTGRAMENGDKELSDPW